MNVKIAIKLSAVIDKMGIKIENPNEAPEKVGADLMMQLVKNAHKAECEIYEFIGAYKGVTPQVAEDEDLAEIIKSFASDSGIIDFFTSAVK